MNSNLQLCFNQIKYALFTFHLEQRQHTWTTPFSMDLQFGMSTTLLVPPYSLNVLQHDYVILIIFHFTHTHTKY